MHAYSIVIPYSKNITVPNEQVVTGIMSHRHTEYSNRNYTYGNAYGYIQTA